MVSNELYTIQFTTVVLIHIILTVLTRNMPAKENIYSIVIIKFIEIAKENGLSRSYDH